LVFATSNSFEYDEEQLKLCNSISDGNTILVNVWNNTSKKVAATIDSRNIQSGVFLNAENKSHRCIVQFLFTYDDVILYSSEDRKQNQVNWDLLLESFQKRIIN